jgi:hypothetical protein
VSKKHSNDNKKNVMAKTAFKKKTMTLLSRKLDLELRKKPVEHKLCMVQKRVLFRN